MKPIDTVSENELQAEVIRILKDAGFTKIYHTYNSQKSEPGYPDILAIRTTDGLMLVLENKTETGKCTKAQLEWLEAFQSIKKYHVAVIRPHDIEDLVNKVRG